MLYQYYIDITVSVFRILLGNELLLKRLPWSGNLSTVVMNLRGKYLCWVNGLLLSFSLLFLFKLSSKECSSKGTELFKLETEVNSHGENTRSRRHFFPSDEDTTSLPATLTTTTANQQVLKNPLSSLQNIFNSLQKQFILSTKKFKSGKWKQRESVPEGWEYSQPDCGRRTPFLMIEVHSKPESFLARETIRLTWGRQRNKINEHLVDKRYVQRNITLYKSENVLYRSLHSYSITV